jgi:CubicO group peptidase (beta-lactamase class C family)
MDSVLRIAEGQQMFDGQILIAENGKLLFDHAYGNMTDGTPITVDTPLSIQSVTKAFTALSILILQDRGLLHIDDKLTDHLRDLPYDEVTLRNLLNMTSGLPRFLPTVIYYGDTTKTWNNKEVITLVSQYKPEAGVPGASFGYNNDNYMLLASVIEEVSGESYADFVQKNIFNPLQMKHSYVSESWQQKTDTDRSSGYYAVYGDGNIYSTAEDLLRFEQSLYTDQLVSSELLDESFRYTCLNDSTASNYGFAWRLSENEHGREAYMVGDGENTRASIQHFMDERKTLIYIHNVSGNNWKPVYSAVRNIWEGKPYTMPSARAIHNIDKELLKNYVGRYLSKAFGLLHITEEDGKLYLRPDPIPGKEELVPSSDTTFYFADQDIEWQFFLDDRGKVIGLGLKGKPETMGPRQ